VNVAHVAVSHERLRSLAQHALLEATIDSVAVVDEGGTIVFVNPALARMLGEDVTGCGLTDLVPAEARGDLEAALAHRAASSAVVEVPLHRPQGSIVWVRVATSPLFDGGRYAGALAVLTDVTERRRSEDALRTIADTSRALAGELDLQAIATVLARSIEGGVLLTTLHRRDAIEVRACASVDARAAAALRPLLGCTVPLSPGTVGEEVVRLGRPVFIATGAASRMQPALVALARELDVASVIVAPLLVHGRPTGTMSVFRASTAPSLTPEDVPLVREIADRAAMALERARLFEDQRRSNERLRLLADAGARMAQSLDVEVALAAFARLTASSFAEACVVELFEKDKVTGHAVAARASDLEDAIHHAIHPYAAASAPPAELRHVFEEGRAELIRVVEDRVVRALAVDEAHVEALRALGLRSLVIVPLLARGVALGVVALARVHEPPYEEGDLAFAEELGRRAALAIDNARLFRSATEAIAVRDEFLSIASHELNTPLTPLKMQLDSLRRGTFSPERTAEKLDAASRQVTRLTKLVSELLDVSRVRVGKLHLEPESLDLAALVDEIAARMADEAERAGSSIVVSAERPCVGQWDRTRLDQVVTNLLTNAVKYGSGKPVEVTLDHADGRARLVVRDHGIGIPPEHQRRIFERFERAASTRHYGGFGLGLWIARQIVEASGGTIRVESEPGQGSTFVVELPR
jgi:PAS domain S-box-containing protein